MKSAEFNMKKFVFFPVVILTLYFFSNFVIKQTDPLPSTLDVEKAIETITAEEFKEHIGFLASDELKGRNTPSDGLLKAARYVALNFKKGGLKSPEGIKEYTQWWYFNGKEVPNCIGYLEGSDPKLKDQYVIIGAHMDHEGIKDGLIYNGADDNASGTTGVLELAEAFGSLKERPKRSIVFMTFSGEEKGLEGSKYYTNNPVFPIARTVAMLNMDMIGRSVDNYLFIGGLGTSSIWDNIINSVKKKKVYNFNLETHKGGRAPSDNSNFYDKGIPALFFFTNIHDDYHRPTDDTERINTATARDISRFIFEIVLQVANTTEKIDFKPSPEAGLPADFTEKMMRWWQEEQKKTKK